MQISIQNSLVFGLVGPIGVDMDAVQDSIKDALLPIGYSVEIIHISNLLEELFDVEKLEKTILKRKDIRHFSTEADKKIAVANEICAIAKTPDALAQLAIRAIRQIKTEKENTSKTVFIIRQLKRPDEIKLLRQVYGKHFVQISATAKKEARISSIANKLATVPSIKPGRDAEDHARRIVDVDEFEKSEDFGQRIEDVYHLADFFVQVDDILGSREDISRIINAFMGRNDVGPTIDEYGSYFATAASIRSVDLSRQVGSAIFGNDGSLISVGCNEVPKAGGGSYWDDMREKFRDVDLKTENNRNEINRIIYDVVERVFSFDFIKSHRSPSKIEERKRELSEGLRESLLGDLTEYGRMTHAEMSAICEAARNGLKIQDATMYVTTFPCHNCSKHIIASGIKRVVYIEPYPKSKAGDLHSDALTIDGSSDKKVSFEHFVGISPKRYRDIFQRSQKRRDKSGQLKVWYSGEPVPQIPDPIDTTDAQEALVITEKLAEWFQPPL